MRSPRRAGSYRLAGDASGSPARAPQGWTVSRLDEPSWRIRLPAGGWLPCPNGQQLPLQTRHAGKENCARGPQTATRYRGAANRACHHMIRTGDLLLRRHFRRVARRRRAGPDALSSCTDSGWTGQASPGYVTVGSPSLGPRSCSNNRAQCLRQLNIQLPPTSPHVKPARASPARGEHRSLVQGRLGLLGNRGIH